jgi:TolB-like protein
VRGISICSLAIMPATPRIILIPFVLSGLFNNLTLNGITTEVNLWRQNVKKVFSIVVFFLLLSSVCMAEGNSENTQPKQQTQPQQQAQNVPDELDLAIRDASDYLNDNIPKGSMIVILNVQSGSAALSDYIIDELIANAVNDRVFKVIDRQQLDLIRAEQNFQLSGEVDDNLALSIGKFFGAQTIVSGRVMQLDNRYRMTVRALEVQTAQVQGQYNRNITAGNTITALMRSGGSGTRTQPAPVRTAGGSTTVTTGGTASGTVPAVTSVTVSPASVSVDKGRTQQFSAEITGTNNPDPAVIWTVSDNTSSSTRISEDGVLTVGDDENITPLTVTATSKADTGKKGSAAVTVPGGIGALNVNNVATWNTAVNRIRNGGNGQTWIINVTGNVAVPVIAENLFGSVTGLTVTIQGGGTLSISNAQGSLLRIGDRQTVIARNVTLRGRSGNNSAVVVIESRGAFRMEDGASVTGNTNSKSGGGVIVNGGTFIMNGGTISGNNSNDYAAFASGSAYGGGGVYVNGGTFTMSGGTISGNTAKSMGGGVYVKGGTFAMQDGTISDNTADYSGGGVCVDSRTLFTMQGGTILGNSANESGGGVYVWGGTITKTGGTIHGSDSSQSLSNTARSQGQAVYSESGRRWRNAATGPDDNTAGYGFWLND